MSFEQKPEKISPLNSFSSRSKEYTKSMRQDHAWCAEPIVARAKVRDGQ